MKQHDADKNNKSQNGSGTSIWAMIAAGLAGLAAGFAIKSAIETSNNESKQSSSAQSQPQLTQKNPPQQTKIQPPGQENSTGGTEAAFEEILICPITNELIKDAVQVNLCGHTFERSALETWVDQRGSCPVCRIATSRNNIIKNFMAQEMINNLRAKK